MFGNKTTKEPDDLARGIEVLATLSESIQALASAVTSIEAKVDVIYAAYADLNKGK